MNMLLYGGVAGRTGHAADIFAEKGDEGRHRKSYNLSLSEIAEELGQTRQAVHYKLRKAEKALKSYEEKLGLVNSYKENRERAQKAYRIIESAGISEPYADKLKRLIDQITE